MQICKTLLTRYLREVQNICRHFEFDVRFSADELDIRGDYVYAKRTKYDEAVNQWNKIFKKPAAPPPHRQTSANATRHQNGSQVRSPPEDRKRKLPWFKIVKGEILIKKLRQLKKTSM